MSEIAGIWRATKQSAVAQALVFMIVGLANTLFLLAEYDCGSFRGIGETWQRQLADVAPQLSDLLPAFVGFEQFWRTNGGNCLIELFRTTAGVDVLLVGVALLCWPIFIRSEMRSLHGVLGVIVDPSEAKRKLKWRILYLAVASVVAGVMFIGDYRSILPESRYVRALHSNEGWPVIHSLLIMPILLFPKVLLLVLADALLRSLGRSKPNQP